MVLIRLREYIHYFNLTAETRQVKQFEWDLNIGGGYKFSLVDFGTKTNIFSISALLTADIGTSGIGRSESTVMNNLLCTIAFVGADEDIVLISAPAQDMYVLHICMCMPCMDHAVVHVYILTLSLHI